MENLTGAGEEESNCGRRKKAGEEEGYNADIEDDVHRLRRRRRRGGGGLRRC